MIKLDKERYIEEDGWIGLDDRYWLRVIKKGKKYKLEMISRRDEFNTKEEAIEYAKHIIWCWSELIKRPK